MRTRIVVVLLILAVLALLAYLGLRLLVAAISKRPGNLGVRDGLLRSCPDMPNCVCSQSTDEGHSIPPMTFSDRAEQARQRMVGILKSMPLCTVVTEEGDYIHAEFRTPGFGYTDDVEFLFDESKGLLHFRSGARLPYYDFHVNRKRMESIRDLWEKR